MEKKPRIYKKPSSPPVFEVIKGITLLHGKPLSHEERMRLKAEALTLKVGLLFDYISHKMADEMQREIIENHTDAHPNGKDERTVDYYRAVLADRRIIIEEIESLAAYVPPKNLPKIDTTGGVNVN